MTSKKQTFGRLETLDLVALVEAEVPWVWEQRRNLACLVELHPEGRPPKLRISEP